MNINNNRITLQSSLAHLFGTYSYSSYRPVDEYFLSIELFAQACSTVWLHLDNWRAVFYFVLYDPLFSCLPNQD